MIKIAWDDSFSTGIEEIDIQHKAFIQLICRLQIMHEKSPPKNLIRRFLLELAKYADYHFTSEENLLIITKYPLLERQRSQHKWLLQTLDAKIKTFEANDEVLGSLIDFSGLWLVNHIKEEDAKIGGFVNRHPGGDGA